MECTTTMSEEETAFKRQPGLRHGCRVHTVSSADGEAAIGGGTCLGVICQYALDLTHTALLNCIQIADLKPDISTPTDATSLV